MAVVVAWLSPALAASGAVMSMARLSPPIVIPSGVLFMISSCLDGHHEDTSSGRAPRGERGGSAGHHTAAGLRRRGGTAHERLHLPTTTRSLFYGDPVLRTC